MKNTLAKLNGWQRLWFVLSAISLVSVTALIFLLWREGKLVEDAQLLAQLNADKVTKVDIPDLGQVAFPNSLTEGDIEKIINENYKSNRKRIPGIAKLLIDDRNQKAAEKARRANQEARKQNTRITLRAYGAWLSLVIVVYVLAYSIGWIYKGFKPA